MLKFLKQNNQEFTTSAFSVSLNLSGIAEVKWKKNVQIITLDQLIELKTILKHLSNGKRIPVLINVNDFTELSSEAKEYISTEIASEFTLANAVILDNLAKRLVFNFLMKVSPPTVPTKSFNNRKDAINWLLKINKEQQSGESGESFILNPNYALNPN